MKKFILIACCIISACAVNDDYQPSLAAHPRDEVKYETDRKYCIEESRQLMSAAEQAHKDDKLIPALGLLGYGIGKANASPDDPYWKTPTQLVNECLTAHGYKLAN